MKVREVIKNGQTNVIIDIHGIVAIKNNENFSVGHNSFGHNSFGKEELLEKEVKEVRTLKGIIKDVNRITIK